MTHKICLIVALVLMLTAGYAQQIMAPQTGTYYLLRADNTLAPLPSEMGTMKGKSKLGGIAGGKVVTQILGAKATVRLKSGDAQTFIIGLESLSDPLPPGLYAMLHRLEVKGDKREVTNINVTSYGIFAKGQSEDPRGIPLNFARHDAHSVTITPRYPLPPGEYGFAATNNKDPYRPADQFEFYCFGID